ncbi:MAG: sulfotransferase family 2 domain-containing protein [Rubellimicrobium sp.]|nr:sulfotransferase family 2 domain-containing protein [Rubellimicrobium sp.]
MNVKVVLIHIPKTAGSTLRATLAQALFHEGGINRKLIGIDEIQPGKPYFDGLAEAAAQRLPELFADGLQVMSGHFRYRDILPVLGAERHRIRLITFLRDPIRRALSDYVYSSSPIHPGHSSFRKSYPTFEAYARNPGEMNKQVDYLRPFEDAPLALTIDNALKNIDFVGLTEHFDSDARQLLEALGARYERQAPENRSPDSRGLEAAMEAHRSMLEEILAPEIALYDAVARQRRIPVRPIEGMQDSDSRDTRSGDRGYPR